MHPLIENYLLKLNGQLKGLSEQQRRDETREIGQHLEMLAVEARERGLTESEAVEKALAQFGPYRKVGRELNRAVLDNSPDRLPKAVSVMTFVMMGQAVFALLPYFWLFSPRMWNLFAQSGGGVGGAIWNIVLSLLLVITSVFLAVSLRKKKLGAFWLALIFMTYKAIRGIFSAWYIFAALSDIHIFYFPYIFNLTKWVIFPCVNLYCLSILISYRQIYLRTASDKQIKT